MCRKVIKTYLTFDKPCIVKLVIINYNNTDRYKQNNWNGRLSTHLRTRWLKVNHLCLSLCIFSLTLYLRVGIYKGSLVLFWISVPKHLVRVGRSCHGVIEQFFFSFSAKKVIFWRRSQFSATNPLERTVWDVVRYIRYTDT